MPERRRALAAAVLASLLAGPACARRAPATGAAAGTTMERAPADISEEYVRLVLALGVHDADYVDAYYGPPAWKAEADSAKVPLETIRTRAAALQRAIASAPVPPADSLARLRHGYLTKQVRALAARVEMRAGRKLSFDEESQVFYDAVAPARPEAYFRALLGDLERALPGGGPVAERYQGFRQQFVIPPTRVDAVFKAAIGACRERTRRFVRLPAGESFTVEYVTGKPWSGYNWYQGSFRSLIQVNTDLPIYVDRALDLACHEGYPGHHVYNALLERHLVRERRWLEFSVYPLFSPQSLVAEGSANYGIAMVFPGAERVEFERTVLFPLAGLDPARAAEYYRVQDLVAKLAYAGNEAARRYLDGEIDAPAAAAWLRRYALMSAPAAEQRLRFVDRYRSYVINYNLGQDIVREYVEREAGAGASAERRWAVFAGLLSSPRLPSDLR